MPIIRTRRNVPCDPTARPTHASVIRHVSLAEARMRPVLLCTLLAASFAAALPARAQGDQVDDDYDVFQVVLAGAAPVTVRQLPEKCGAFGPGWFQQLYRMERARARVTCRMTETEELRAAGGVRWRFARYTRRWVIPPADSRTRGESRDEEIVVLFSQATEGGRLYPQWMASYGPDFIARVYLLTAPAPDGRSC